MAEAAKKPSTSPAEQSTLPEIPEVSQKKTGRSPVNKGFLKLCFWILGTVCFFLLCIILFKGCGGKSGPTSTMVNPLAPRITPPICEDAWQKSGQGLGDHREQEIEFFFAHPTPVTTDIPACFGEWIYPPSSWHTWEKQFKSQSDQCWVWFYFFGKQPIGPFGPHNLPEFPIGTPTKWRVSTNCALRYYRTS